MKYRYAIVGIMLMLATLALSYKPQGEVPPLCEKFNNNCIVDCPKTEAEKFFDNEFHQRLRETCLEHCSTELSACIKCQKIKKLVNTVASLQRSEL